MVDPDPKELAHWVPKEMQNNKKQAKYTVLWLLLSVIAKMSVKESVGVESDDEPTSDFSQSEPQLLTSGPLPKLYWTPDSMNTTSGHQKVCPGWTRAKPRNY